MNVVDTHAHVSPCWYEPVEALLYQMDRIGVTHAVLVQFLGQEDNSYILECTLRFRGRFAAVALVDPSRPDAVKNLQRWISAGAQGIRLRCTDRSPGSDPLAIWKAAASAGVPVSCLGTVEEFTDHEFRKLVERFPEVPVIMEHFGLLQRIAPPFPRMDKLVALADLPNLYVKIGGLGELAPRSMPFDPDHPFATRVEPVLKILYHAFGPRRMMWGSDFPPVCGREGYHLAFTLPRAQMPCSEEDREWIFGGTAASLFKFGSPAEVEP